ncbi:transposase [Kibdelosporangium philippinense]|uniref:transposase n=1 Tax=Kibdelosporangium philippinense TaxID=211113 RepID=UPI003558ED32
MGSTRRRFTEEYKAQAVALVIDDHRPIAEVARNIGVHAITLGSWVKKARGPIPRRVRHWRIRSALSWSGCVRRTPS